MLIFWKKKMILQIFDDGRLHRQSLYMQVQDFQTYLLIYYDKSGIDPSTLPQSHLALAWRVSVRHSISVCSSLMSFVMSKPCLFSDLVFKSAIFKELPEVHEVVKVYNNCLSFRNLWYSWIALGSALIFDKVNEPIR